MPTANHALSTNPSISDPPTVLRDRALDYADKAGATQCRHPSNLPAPRPDLLERLSARGRMARSDLTRMTSPDLVELYRTLSVTDERIAILIALLGFTQQIALLLWKFLNAG